jgi:poly [ADP-ribose] polymerase
VAALVDYIWTEASGRLKDVLAVSVESIKVEQVDKAEAELLTIKRLLSDSSMERAKRGIAMQPSDYYNPNPCLPSLVKDAEISKHSHAFYSSLPHKSASSKGHPIETIRIIAEKQDLCQLIRDIVSISESTNWSVRSGTEAKYRALRCDIEHLEPTSLEYAKIRDHLLNSQDE